MEVNKVSLIRKGLDIAQRTSPVKEIAKDIGKEREPREVGEKIGEAMEITKMEWSTILNDVTRGRSQLN